MADKEEKKEEPAKKEEKAPEKKPEPEILDDDEFGSDDDERKDRIEKQWNPQLVEACKTGNVKDLKGALQQGADMHQWDKKKKRKWTPLIWACCNGHRDIVRVLIDNGVLDPYLKTQRKLLGEDQDMLDMSDDDEPQQDEDDEKEKFTDEFGKPIYGKINTESAPSPLAWAAFKGHLQIVWLLLKGGLKPIDYDMFGNTVIHQAVSGGNYKVVKCLLQYGILLEEKNSRKHSILDLATDPNIKHLLKMYFKTKEDTFSKEKFEPLEVKYLCGISEQFFKKKNVKQFWSFETHQSEEKECFECRSIPEIKLIEKTTGKLNAIMKSNQENKLRDYLKVIDEKPKMINEIQSWEGDLELAEGYYKINVDEKLLNKGHILLEKLRTQNIIKAKIDTLVVIEDYKTIRKHIIIINKFLDDADKRGVKIDTEFRSMSKATNARMKAERNLRFELDNLEVATATPKQVEHLNDLYEIAVERGVGGQEPGTDDYCENALTLKTKMSESIEVTDIMKEFALYGERENEAKDKKDLPFEYPPIVVMEPKDRKPAIPKNLENYGGKLKLKRGVNAKKYDPEYLKSLMEPPKPPKKKNKRKKKAVFEDTIPEWATESQDMRKKIDRITELSKKTEDLCISEEVGAKIKSELARITKDWTYRRVKEIQIQLHEENAK